jgi:hypothetical protein
MEGGKTLNEGLCMPCARELGINTMQQMAGGLDMGDMENLEAQMMEMFENEDMEGEDLMGWLIPCEKADEFEYLWFQDKSDENWDNYFGFAVWEENGNSFSIKFII